MNDKFPTLMSPLTVRGHVFKNRIEFGPTLNAHYVLTFPDIKENVYRMAEERAKGGAGAVTAGELCVNFEEARGAYADRVIDYRKHSGEDFEAMKCFADRIKKHGALAFIEVCHAGSAAECRAPYVPWGPEGYTRRDGIEVKALTRLMMRKICSDLKAFGAFAAAAGFDGVLLQGGHGSIIQQFVSERTNHRTDGFGGSPERRAEFPKMMIKALRKGLGNDKIIEMRISAEDGVNEPGAMKPENAAEFAKAVDGMVDILQVSTGLGNGSNATGTLSGAYAPHGLNADAAGRIKAGLRKTYVSVVGGIDSPKLAETIVSEGRADIIVLGREGFADPDFANKIMNNKADLIRPCLRCFGCWPGNIEHPSDAWFGERGFSEESLKRIFSPQATGRCTVNPCSGLDRTAFDELPPVKEKKKVLIIGGGPAGMQAAVTASARGHEVTLVEKNASLGGLPAVTASADPNKKDIARFIRVLEREAEACAEIRIGITADAEFVKNFGADVVLIAAGSEYKKPEKIEGSENLKDIRLAYTMPPRGKKVLVLGGGISACETALYLQNAGNDTTLVLNEKFPAKDVIGGARNALLVNMERAGVKLVYEARFRKVESGAVECVFPDDSSARIEGDIIYSALSSRSRDELYRDLVLSGIKIYAIGDSAMPGRIRDAVHNAYETAVKIGV